MMKTYTLKCRSMSPKQRRHVIKEHILTKTTPQIATLCGVSKRTIVRDIRKWKNEGGFEELLYDEFIRLYPTIKQTYPEKAFDRLCYLLGKTVTTRTEIKEEITSRQEITVNVNELSTEERQLARNLARKTLPKLPDPYHRRIPDQLRNVACDPHDCPLRLILLR